MTLIVVIASNKDNEISAYSDSRVSAQSTLLDSVGKLLPMPVKIFNPDQTIAFNNSFGFAFAGSTLVAQTVHSLASASLQNLRLEEGSQLPSLEEIAQYVAIMTKKIVHELGSNVTTPKTSQVGFFIFGFCPASRRRRLFEIETQITSSTFDVAFGELDVVENGRCYCLGDKLAIEHFWEKSKKLDVLVALKNIIDSEDIPAVGGDIQALVSSHLGARNVATLNKTERGTVIIKILNQELDGVTVGDCHFKNMAIMAPSSNS